MIIVTLRHYVGDEKQASELEIMVNRILKSKSKNPNIQFRLGLNWPEPEKVPKEVRDTVKKLTNLLYDNSITVESYRGFGIGYAFFKTVFNYLSETNLNYADKQKVLFLVDGNQFDVSDDRVITGIINIANKLTQDDRVVGLALRDYVKLAADEDDDELRRIEELYHLNVCSRIDISNPQSIDTKEIHPAYLKYGDIVPGLIGFNVDSEIFKNMLLIIHQDVRRTDLTKYQADPYTIMLAGILTKQKGFYSEVIPTTRMARGSRFDRTALTVKAKSLKQTFVGNYYKKSVEDMKFEAELLKYFKPQNVREAKERILDGFK